MKMQNLFLFIHNNMNMHYYDANEFAAELKMDALSLLLFGSKYP